MENLPSNPNNKKTKKILGPKTLALIMGLSSFNGDKNPEVNIEETKKIETLKENLEKTYEDTKQIDSIPNFQKTTEEISVRELPNDTSELKDQQNEPLVEKILDSKVDQNNEFSPEVDKNESKKSLENIDNKFNQQEFTESLSDFLDAVSIGLQQEKGLEISIVKRKIKKHKEDIINVIPSINKFKEENRKFITVLDSMYFLNPNIEGHRAQINLIAITYELYKNGNLEEVSDPGILASIYASVSGKQLSLYKKIHKDIENFKKYSTEKKQEIHDLVLRRSKIDLTQDELEHMTILSRIAQSMNAIVNVIAESAATIESTDDVSKILQRNLKRNPELKNKFDKFIDTLVKE